MTRGVAMNARSVPARLPACGRASTRHRLAARTALVATALVVAAVILSGCDKCGDFVWNKPGACHAGPPQP